MARGSRAQIRAASGTSDFSRLFDPHHADLFDDTRQESGCETAQCSRVPSHFHDGPTGFSGRSQYTGGLQLGLPLGRFSAWPIRAATGHSSPLPVACYYYLWAQGHSSQLPCARWWSLRKGCSAFSWSTYPMPIFAGHALENVTSKHRSYTDGTWRSVCYIYQSRKRLCGLRPRYPVAELATG